jgi:hypothetical protein
MSGSLARALVAAGLTLGTFAAYADPTLTPANIPQAAHAACAEAITEMRALYTTRTVSTPALDQINYENILAASQVQCEAGLSKALLAK